MTYTLNADNLNQRVKQKLITTSSIVVVVVVTIVIMVVLFPKKMLLEGAILQQEPRPIALYYLKQLSQHYPKNNDLRIALIKQQIGNEDWKGAKQQLAILFRARDKAILDQANWLQYRLSYTYAYRLPDNDPNRGSELNHAKNHAIHLIGKSLTVAELQQLGSDLLGFESPEASLTVFLRLAYLKPITDLNLLAQIAKVALFAGNYLVSGNYYFLVAKKVDVVKAKREYIMNGLKAYQEGNLLSQGLTAVSKFRRVVINDEAMLDFLANYALAADRPDLAQKYVKRLLLLPQMNVSKR